MFLVDFHPRLPVLPLSEPSSVVTWGCHFTEEPAVHQAFTDTTSFNSVPRGYHCNPHFTEADTKPQKGESCQASHSLWLEFAKLMPTQPGGQHSVLESSGRVGAEQGLDSPAKAVLCSPRTSIVTGLLKTCFFICRRRVIIRGSSSWACCQD